MTIGEKRKRVRIEQAVLVADNQGGHATTYALRAVVWAHERALTGRETLQAAQVTATLASVWEIWFRDDVRVSDRLRAGPSRILEIAAVFDPTDRRDELHLVCVELQGVTS